MHLFSKENIWSNPHASSIHPVIQTSTIILWSELFPKKRREKIQGEILQSIFEYSGVSTYNTRTTRFLRIQCILQCFHMQSSNSKIFLHTELILLQEFSKKYYNYKAHPVQINTRHLPATVPVSPSILHGRIKLPASLQVFQGHTALAGFQLILPGRIALQAAASIHTAPTVTPRRIPTEFYQEK